MTDKEKLNMLEEMLDIEKDTLNEETSLDELQEWDSIAVISTVALFDSEFGRDIMPPEIKSFRTIKDITALMK